MTKRTRGRRSKVDLLPEDIKDALNEMLRDGRLLQKDILDIVNQKIEEAGLEDEAQLSRSGLNRFASRMEEIGSKIRQVVCCGLHAHHHHAELSWPQRFQSDPQRSPALVLAARLDACARHRG